MILKITLNRYIFSNLFILIFQKGEKNFLVKIKTHSKYKIN